MICSMHLLCIYTYLLLKAGGGTSRHHGRGRHGDRSNDNLLPAIALATQKQRSSLLSNQSKVVTNLYRKWTSGCAVPVLAQIRKWMKCYQVSMVIKNFIRFESVVPCNELNNDKTNFVSAVCPQNAPIS